MIFVRRGFLETPYNNQKGTEGVQIFVNLFRQVEKVHVIHTKFIIARNDAKICEKIHEFAQREIRGSNSWNLLVIPAQTSLVFQLQKSESQTCIYKDKKITDFCCFSTAPLLELKEAKRQDIIVSFVFLWITCFSYFRYSTYVQRVTSSNDLHKNTYKDWISVTNFTHEIKCTIKKRNWCLKTAN